MQQAYCTDKIMPIIDRSEKIHFLWVGVSKCNISLPMYPLSLFCFLCVMHLTTLAQCLRLLIIFSDKFPQFLQTISLSFFNFFIPLIVVLCLFLHFFLSLSASFPICHPILLYILTSVWVLCTQNTVFQILLIQNVKKEAWTQPLAEGFIPRKKTRFHNLIDISDTKNKKVWKQQVCKTFL